MCSNSGKDIIELQPPVSDRSFSVESHRNNTNSYINSYVNESTLVRSGVVLHTCGYM
jgi:hypothetical protein